MTTQVPPEEIVIRPASCSHVEVESQFFQTECGSHYANDEQNDPFKYCPYCGRDIGHE